MTPLVGLVLLCLVALYLCWVCCARMDPLGSLSGQACGTYGGTMRNALCVAQPACGT